ncbi:arginine--tRNA ligase [Sinorhizobium meliloti]|uniref:arginine--tRNA ligase domain-containing protein n=1 Tax=Rhizobium meliloti TaxID=382 RepID=UPI0029A7F7C1|nr:arginine--tRNA ligase [Sinorhizobium meliloti]MDW9664718.1 arginine--tRNA ligase [Sinorhizobium meliloti]MDX0054552.1 arginine--tRNA ligase [Sinorhizobium meliloti]
MLASEVVEAIPSTFFEDVSVAGPGFVNFRLTDAAIAMEASAMLADPSLAAEKVEPMRTVIDFGGPNVAKALHVGHLRSFAIGESLPHPLGDRPRCPIRHPSRRLRSVALWDH